MKTSQANSKNNGMKNLTLLASAALIAFGLGACKSKKTSEETGATTESAATESGSPAIDQTPMSFDTAGSDSGKIAGLKSINFEYDRSALTSEAKKRIQANADWLKTQDGMKLQIEGHCDSRGSIEYNLSLGERRAQAVKNYMVSLGVNGERLSIISYGKEKPLSNGDSEADHQKNRRANFLPLGK